MSLSINLISRHYHESSAKRAQSCDALGDVELQEQVKWKKDEKGGHGAQLLLFQLFVQVLLDLLF